MKNLLKFLFLLIILIHSQIVFSQHSIPHLSKKGNATQLIVENKPLIVLGGELGNSTAVVSLESSLKLK